MFQLPQNALCVAIDVSADLHDRNTAITSGHGEQFRPIGQAILFDRASGELLEAHAGADFSDTGEGG